MQIFYTRLLSLLFIIVFCPIMLKAQNDRINAGLPAITQQPLWSLEKATGWVKNKEGQWIEEQNKIYHAATGINQKAQWKDNLALGKDNFIKYELRTIKISGMDFLLFTKVMRYGYWTNPTTQYEWHPQDRVYYAVIKKNEAVKDKNPFDTDGVSIDYRTPIYFLSYLPLDSGYLNKIALHINETDISNADYRKYGTNRTLDIRYKPLADAKACRFHLYAGGINSSGVDMLPKDSDERLVNVFADFYFECPRDKFEGMIGIIEPKKGR